MMTNLNKMTEIQKIARVWQLQLNLEYNNPKKNVRLAFKDIGAFTEFLSIDYCDGYIGSGSGGMGLDLSNKKLGKAIEVKSCCIIQNAKCNECGTKFDDLFLKSCPNCFSKNYSKPDDSRFGIDAKELLSQLKEGIFDKMIMCCLKQERHDEVEKVLDIELEWFSISFRDDEIKEYQLDYFKNQIDKGKKAHCNLLPYSFDFYKLCPQRVSRMTVSMSYADLNKIPEVKSYECFGYVRVPISVLRISEREKFINLDTYDKESKTADCRDFTKNISYRSKSLGKERGDTRKNVYGVLKK